MLYTLCGESLLPGMTDHCQPQSMPRIHRANYITEKLVVSNLGG